MRTLTDLSPVSMKGISHFRIKICFRFYPSKVKACIEEVVLRNLKDKEYEHATAKLMAETIADQIKMQVKALNIPSYKIVVQTVIGEITGQGVRVASKCLWDD